ncbi:hypothetical protein HK099_002542 [Clydaea vesicula]|uniref:N-acetyltransferase domain-containing protein n=1 Tax=Clydaea vesicula TaxID=447962 RepID=A0AAD5XZ86_9FUNG|nr:hypothetical protein HK099_002542 [Clydaea vesicula]KAJ3383225.1 hypothetical protein HDU92_004296 [Lobulomyces angularis]
MIKQITEKADLFKFFKKDLVLFGYHVGDLDDYFFKDCSFYCLHEKDDSILENICIYQKGDSTPTVLVLSTNPDLTNLTYIFGEMLKQKILISSFYIHFQTYEIFSNFNKLINIKNDFGKHLKLKFNLNKLNSLKEGIGFGDAKLITSDNLEQVEKLYKHNFPDNYFEPNILKTNKYYGIWIDNKLVSIAGVHCMSVEFKVSTLGNITTHIDYRRKGFCKRCVASVVVALIDSGIDSVSLNVKADNAAAIKLYQSLGFEVHCSIFEAEISVN